MSIYDKASLVLIPSGTKTSKVYSQVPTNGDGDFTFSRSTAATRVNASGNIEKETQNLLLQSNNFDTTWTNVGSTETSGQSGYDGSNDAWLIERVSTGGYIYQDISKTGVNTISVYAKAGSLNWMRLRVGSAPKNSRYFDLENGVIGTGGTAPVDSKIESVGNGWYRCSITTDISIDRVYFYPVPADGDISGSSGNIYIQDAQLEQGLVARDYIETTTTAIYGGITDNVPRLDYTDSSCPALLLEPQRTNVVVDSENFIGGSWSYAGTYGPNTTMNQAVSPEGVQNAALIAAAGAGNDRIQDNLGSQSNNLLYSIFVKSAGVDTRVKLRNSATNSDSRWDVGADGSVTFYSSTETNYGQEDYGDGWYRIWFEAEMDGSTTFFQFYPDEDNGDGSVYVYGAQAEQGSYATSYIPTYGSAVTRNRGELPNRSVSDFFPDSSKGSVYFEIDDLGHMASGASANFRFGASSGSPSLQWSLYLDPQGVKVYNYNKGTYLISANGTNVGETYKFLVVFDGNESTGFRNGTKYTTLVDDESFDINYLSNWNTNNNAFSIKKMMFFPNPLTDQEAIDLTTL